MDHCYAGRHKGNIEELNMRYIISLPAYKILVSVKWAYNVKNLPYGSIPNIWKYLFERDCYKILTVNSSKVFSPVARIKIVRLVVVMANYLKWDQVCDSCG